MYEIVRWPYKILFPEDQIVRVRIDMLLRNAQKEGITAHLAEGIGIASRQVEGVVHAIVGQGFREVVERLALAAHHHIDAGIIGLPRHCPPQGFSLQAVGPYLSVGHQRTISYIICYTS